jgi:hypothetical protein
MSSPDQKDSRTGGNSNAAAGTELTLERRLELLETRFTKPAEASEAAQPLLITTTKNEGSAFSRSSNSQHSFSFSASNSMGADNSPSSHSNLPSSAVRSKRRPSLNTSFHAVERATARHLRKVAANSPVQGMTSNNNNNNGNNGNASNLSRLSVASNSNASQQTLVTSHVQRRIVAESPPVPVTPGMATTPNPSSARGKRLVKPAAARNILQAQTTNPSNGGGNGPAASGIGSTTTPPVASSGSNNTVSVDLGRHRVPKKLEITDT